MQIEILNLDEECANDMKSGNGFPIDRPVTINRKDMIRDQRGIYSSLFGGDISDVSEIQKQYTCRCGRTIGRFKAGTICPHCGTVVEYQNGELEKYGWMELKKPYVLIHPNMYHIIEQVLKSKVLDSIIKYDKKLDKHGMIDMTVKPKNAYENIGIVEFMYRFDEIIANLGDKKRKKEIEFLMANRDKIFISHIPVISLLMRPVVLIGATTFNYDPINKFYSEILSNVSYINMNNDDELINTNLMVLYELQKKLNELDAEIINKKLNGKKQLIRTFIMGSRINFSARHVLVSNVYTTKLNAIEIPYRTFVSFYKFQIMNIYKKLYNVTINELQNRWYELVERQDPSIMQIINLLIRNTKNGMRLYNNRNPTIAVGSTTVLRLRKINDDINDFAMRMVLGTCKIANADFDGDTLNNVPIMETRIADKMEKFFSPDRFIISTATGKFNRDMNLIKDELVALYSFANDDFDDDDDFDDQIEFSIVDSDMIAKRDAAFAQMQIGA